MYQNEINESTFRKNSCICMNFDHFYDINYTLFSGGKFI